MEQEEVVIKTLPVEIRVIRVGGHKMTLSVFDQLPQEDIFEMFDVESIAGFSISEFECENSFEEGDLELTDGAWDSIFQDCGYEILGYVQRQGFWLLLIKNSKLVKVSSVHRWVFQDWSTNRYPLSRVLGVFIETVLRKFDQVYIAT